MQRTTNEIHFNRENGIGRNGPYEPLIKPTRWKYLQNKFELTPRERQIAELVCRGMRNEDIAKELGISSGTAKTHIRNIYRKVHVKSKISMLLMFVAAADCLND
jgi:DNA-binding CsgD family transcriptional regulator